MKFLSKIGLFCSLLVVSSMVFAKDPLILCDSDAIHCAYVTGISNSNSDGRYITFGVEGQKFPPECTNNNSTYELLKEDASKAVGNNRMPFYICQDASVKNCQQVAVDNFTVSKGADGNYVATPNLFNIDFSSYKNKFKACNVTNKKILFIK